MRQRSSVLILLIVAAFLGWALRPHRVNRLDPRSSRGAAVVAKKMKATLAASHPASIAFLAPWRHRIKSVLQEKHGGSRPIERGPAPIPDQHHLPAGLLRNAPPSTPLIARRC